MTRKQRGRSLTTVPSRQRFNVLTRAAARAKQGRTLRALAMAALVTVAGVATGQAAELTYSGTFQFASGDYTLSETTRSFILLSDLSYTTGRWNLSVSIPLIHQDSPFVTYSGGTPIPSGRRQGASQGSSPEDSGSGNSQGSGSGRGGGVDVPPPETLDFDENGVGDPILRADFAVFEGPAGGLEFGVYGAVKPPLASEDSGFGTGEWDYGAGITASKEAGSSLLFADLGYWLYGDLPDFELKNPITYSVGLDRGIAASRYSVVALLSGSTETIDGVDGPVRAAVTLSRSGRSNRSCHVTLAAGLTESAPDYSLAAGWRVGIR